MLKDDHISKWEKEDRWHGIALFAYLTVQMQNLKEYKEATLVSTEPAVYIKTGRRPGKTQENRVDSENKHDDKPILRTCASRCGHATRDMSCRSSQMIVLKGETD
jgi:capsid protein